MTISKQKFNVDYASKAKFQDGLREFLEYRDLGIADASNGAYKAHVLRVKKISRVIKRCILLGFTSIW